MRNRLISFMKELNAAGATQLDYGKDNYLDQKLEEIVNKTLYNSPHAKFINQLEYMALSRMNLDDAKTLDEKQLNERVDAIVLEVENDVRSELVKQFEARRTKLNKAIADKKLEEKNLQAQINKTNELVAKATEEKDQAKLKLAKDDLKAFEEDFKKAQKALELGEKHLTEMKEQGEQKIADIVMEDLRKTTIRLGSTVALMSPQSEAKDAALDIMLADSQFRNIVGGTTESVDLRVEEESANMASTRGLKEENQFDEASLPPVSFTLLDQNNKFNISREGLAQNDEKLPEQFKKNATQFAERILDKRYSLDEDDTRTPYAYTKLLAMKVLSKPISVEEEKAANERLAFLRQPLPNMEMIDNFTGKSKPAVSYDLATNLLFTKDSKDKNYCLNDANKMMVRLNALKTWADNMLENSNKRIEDKQSPLFTPMTAKRLTEFSAKVEELNKQQSSETPLTAAKLAAKLKNGGDLFHSVEEIVDVTENKTNKRLAYEREYLTAIFNAHTAANDAKHHFNTFSEENADDNVRNKARRKEMVKDSLKKVYHVPSMGDHFEGAATTLRNKLSELGIVSMSMLDKIQNCYKTTQAYEKIQGFIAAREKAKETGTPKDVEKQQKLLDETIVTLEKLRKAAAAVLQVTGSALGGIFRPKKLVQQESATPAPVASSAPTI